jgi:hypothetical protein
LPPAAMVVAVERPVMLNPAPVTVTCENVRVVLPLFVKVMVWELLLPIATFPKLTLVGEAAISAWRPVPLKAMVAGDPGALLVMEMLPDALPADVGAKVTVKVLFCPALMVNGAARFMV